MKFKNFLGALLMLLVPVTVLAQERTNQPVSYIGTVSSLELVSPLIDRPDDMIPAVDRLGEAKDKRSMQPIVNLKRSKNEVDDILALNRHAMEQSETKAPASLVFDAYASNSQPTDPSLAVGPNHVMVVYNTGFTIYDKSGNQLLGQTSPSPAIFPSGGCCDLTASYDTAADRWVLSFLGNGAQIAVSDGPNPLTASWYVYTISTISDYQKLSVWSDGYYITDNTGSNNKVWALERAAMLNGSPSAQILGFNLPGIATSGFYSPQALNVTDGNMPAAGGATIVYMQDDAWTGVSNDHIKLWTIDVDWNNPGSSTVSTPQEVPTTPFIGVFDNGSFSNLLQPGNGRRINIDALQATIMNQAQFRKFAGHNSAVFNFVVDTDASGGERAGVRWYEFRQSGDNQPWSLYQEGTYTAPDGRHAWNASMAMDGNGNIGMGYTSMSGPSTGSRVYVSSYFTGRMDGDPLGVMTAAEGLIANGDAKIPGTRYGDYSKIDVDPSDDSTFWFINEYMNSGRRGVVGVFQMQGGGTGGDTEPPTVPTDLVVNSITETSGVADWTASSDNVGVAQYNVTLDGNPVGSTSNTSFNLSGLTANTTYTVGVSAEDAAGNESAQATTSFTTLQGGGNPGEIAAYYFETGLQGWIDGGNDCARQASSNSFEGTYSIRLRDDSNSSNAISPNLNLSGNSQITIEFHTYASSMENGEDYFIEFDDGSGFQVIGQYISGTDFSNGSFFTDTIVLSSANYNFGANNRFRIRCDASANNDQVWFDQIIISGDAAATGGPVTQSRTSLELFNDNYDDLLKLFPNPTQNSINISTSGTMFNEVVITNALGQVYQRFTNFSADAQLDVSGYMPGVYYVRFVKDGYAISKRFIKN